MNWRLLDGERFAGSLERELPVLHPTHTLYSSCASRLKWWSQGLPGKIPMQPMLKGRGVRGLVGEERAEEKGSWPTLGITSKKIFPLWAGCWDRWNHFSLSSWSYYISTYSYSKGWVTPITRLYLEQTQWQTACSSECVTGALRALPYPASSLTAENQSRFTDTKRAHKV